MIKEKKRKKFDKKLELKLELFGYLKTAFVSFCVGALVAFLLSFHARSEMIKNLYESKDIKAKIEQKIAKQMIAHSDFMSELNSQNYSICMRVGNIYEAAGEYKNAEYAYYLATQKAPEGVYTSFYKLALSLIAQDKVDDAEEVINSVNDVSELNLIRFKTRANIVLGDKYYSKSKFLKASKYYEKANYYYDRLEKKDKAVSNSIRKRLVNSYLEAACVILKNGYNSDAVRFLKKALKYEPDNSKIKYRLAIVYSDLDPIKSVEYFETLVAKIPQEIDYNVYNKALMKAANIEDLGGNNIKAKYYRYKIHSLDLFINQKVVYKDDIETNIERISVKKSFLGYKLDIKILFKNVSASDIFKMNAEFVLRHGEKVREKLQVNCANKKQPLLSNGGTTDTISVELGKNIFTRKEFANYYLDIYVFKDKQYKTLIGSYKVPVD